MSAIGPFWGKADMRLHCEMSAFDPKRTSLVAPHGMGQVAHQRGELMALTAEARM